MELNRIRLTAARTYVRALESSLTPITDTQEPLKMNAVVRRKEWSRNESRKGLWLSMCLGELPTLVDLTLMRSEKVIPCLSSVP